MAENQIDPPQIKSIVMSGGGITIFPFYGILKQTNIQGVWKYENIKTIYATSAGSILAVFIALDYEWNTLDDYMIKRPWQNVLKIDVSSLTGFINKRGFFNIKNVEDIFSPVFSGKDIDIHITLEEFYRVTGIDIHFFTTTIDPIESIDINYKTHPHWRVVEAVYCSSCLPILFSPFFKDGKWYCDGGVTIHYPLKNCIDDGNDIDEIMGLEKQADNKENKMDENFDIFDYIIFIISKIISLILKRNIIVIPREYKFIGPPINIFDILKVSSNMDERIRLINVGEEIAKSK